MSLGEHLSYMMETHNYYLAYRKLFFTVCCIYVLACLLLGGFILFQILQFILDEIQLAILYLLPKLYTLHFLIFISSCAVFQYMVVNSLQAFAYLSQTLFKTADYRYLHELDNLHWMQAYPLHKSRYRDEHPVRCLRGFSRCASCRMNFFTREELETHQRETGHLGVLCFCEERFDGVEELDGHVAVSLAGRE